VFIPKTHYLYWAKSLPYQMYVWLLCNVYLHDKLQRKFPKGHFTM
jgi:hypothetical protein